MNENGKTKISDLIRARGLKQKWIAERVGITETYLSMICSGDANPSEDILQKLAVVLKVQFSELIKQQA